MFTVGVKFELHPRLTITAEDVSDLIESVVDTLDDLGFEADASSSGTGADLVLSVEVVVDAADPLEAQAIGIGAIVQGVRAGQVDVADLAPTGLVTSTQTLQPA